MKLIDPKIHNGIAALVLTFLSSLAFSPLSLAQNNSTAVAPGEYVGEGGKAYLTLKSGKSGSLNFEISSLGDNGHTCSLEGQLRNGRAQLEGIDEKTPCIVTMKMTPTGIDVKDSSGGACQTYCGVRATFEMIYFQPIPACLSAAVSNTRKQFKTRYDSKQFLEARALLEPLLKDCKRSLDWIEDARIRNDLAVTLHKLGEMAECRNVLQPLAEDAAMTDKKVRESYPPLEAGLYLPVVRATRTNLRLCK